MPKGCGYANRLADAKRSSTMKRRYIESPELRAEISRMVCNYWTTPEGQRVLEHKPRGGGHGKREYLTTRKGGSFWCWSSFESGYARLLDEDSTVLKFLYEPVRIPYFWQGKKHFTKPDFLVWYHDDTIVLVEVKPSWVVEKESQVRMRLSVMRLFAESVGWEFRWWDGWRYLPFSF